MIGINFISIADRVGSVYVVSAIIMSVGMLMMFVILRKLFAKMKKSRSDSPDPMEVQRSKTPCAVNSRTEALLPQIMNDFPQFDYQFYRNKAEALLRSYFTALEIMKSSELREECSQTLINKVDSLINDMKARDVIMYFHSTEIHDVQISDYIKTGSTVTIVFQISVGQYAYVQNAFGKIVGGNKSLKHQTVYEVGLTYVQDVDKAGENSGLGVVCPNCGAPVKNLGAKFCEYCGTGIVEVNERAWKFDSVNELALYRM